MSMSKLPVVSGIEVVKALSKIGYVHVRTAGSHAILIRENANGRKVVPVPLHRELAKGTLLSIMRQADLKRIEFFKLLK